MIASDGSTGPADSTKRSQAHSTKRSRRDDPPCAGIPRPRAGVSWSVPQTSAPANSRVRCNGLFSRLKGRWHRAPLLVQAPEQFKTAISRPEKGLESGGIILHKFPDNRRLCFDDLVAAHTPQNSCFRSIPNMQKWHKRPKKAATLCHFLSFFWARFKSRHAHRAFAQQVACSLTNTENSLPRSCGIRCRRQVDYQAGAKQLGSETRGGSIGKEGFP